ncbi:unnamed protein product [Musa hybrid cultivar]
MLAPISSFDELIICLHEGDKLLCEGTIKSCAPFCRSFATLSDHFNVKLGSSFTIRCNLLIYMSYNFCDQ